jgi:hypothetical protein
MKHLVFISCLIIISFFVESGFAIMLEMNIEELTNDASFVVIGEVSKIECARKDGGGIYTFVDLQIARFVKGFLDTAQITVIFPGGEVDGIGERVEDMPSFKEKEKVLVFLNPDVDNYFGVKGGWQGKFTIYHDEFVGRLDDTSSTFLLADLVKLIQLTAETGKQPLSLTISRSASEFKVGESAIITATLTNGSSLPAGIPDPCSQKILANNETLFDFSVVDLSGDSYVEPTNHSFLISRLADSLGMLLNPSDSVNYLIDLTKEYQNLSSGTYGLTAYCSPYLSNGTFLWSKVYSNTINLKIVPTAIDQFSVTGPDNFLLSQNYPNPFNSNTVIRYKVPGLATSVHVALKIFDLQGQEVVTLIDENQSAGYHVVDWNASQIATGIYFYRLQAGNFIDSKKMILLR